MPSAGGVNRAFLWQDGNMRDLGDLSGGNSASVAIGINNLGQVVGQSGTNGGAGHAFLWTDSDGMIDLGSLDGNPSSTSEADAVNDQGQIIGSSYSFDFNATHAVYYGPCGIVDLGTLGGPLSLGLGMNVLGQVVGESATANGLLHAFLTDLETMQMVDLNTLIPPDSGWNLIDAMSINDAGQITGEGGIGGQTHAYLLTPDDGGLPTRSRRELAVQAGRGLVEALVATPRQAIPGIVANDFIVSRPPADTGPAEGMREGILDRWPATTSNFLALLAEKEQPTTDGVWAVHQSVGQRTGAAHWLDTAVVRLRAWAFLDLACV
jgi:probable HAF family extracellular repeat protein